MEEYFIHPTAIVDTNNIGDKTRIWAFVHILKGANIGTNCNICDHCFIENDVVIGDNVTIKSGIYIWDGARIENNVFLGPNVVFTNDIFPRSKMYPEKFHPINIQEGASIGANSVIVAGTTIGRYAMIGAGSVITKDVPDFTLVYGNPARNNGYVCRCAQKIVFNEDVAKCTCGLQFIKTSDGIRNI